MKVPVSTLVKGLRNTISQNSPAILTGMAVAGTISTAVLSAKAHAKAVILTQSYEDAHTELMTPREKFDMTWKIYIPAVGTGVATVVCIIASNRVSTKRASAFAAAYSITERAFDEYKEKVVEQIGVNKEQRIRDSIAQDRVHDDPVSSREVIITGNGEVLCYETITGRYFNCDMETIRKAQNDVNAQIFNEMYASLNDFNRRIGLPVTSYGETIGWNTDKMLETQISAVLSEDQRPCLSIGYRHLPFPSYHHIY